MGKCFLSSCNCAITVLDTMGDVTYGCCPQEVDRLARNARLMEYQRKMQHIMSLLRTTNHKTSRKGEICIACTPGLKEVKESFQEKAEGTQRFRGFSSELVSKSTAIQQVL